MVVLYTKKDKKLRKSEILQKAFALKKEDIPDMVAVCGMCGHKGEMLNSKKAITPTTSGMADMFKHGSGICFECASCVKESRLLTSNIYADSRGLGLKPVVSEKSANEERPTWRSLINSEQIVGRETVVIFTSNVQRRLWHNAPIGVVGESWQVLYVHENTEAILKVSIYRLKEILQEVELLLNLGFSKRSIETSLLSHHKIPHDLLKSTLEYNKRVSLYRNTDEFKLSLFIAQRTEM